MAHRRCSQWHPNGIFARVAATSLLGLCAVSLGESPGQQRRRRASFRMADSEMTMLSSPPSPTAQLLALRVGGGGAAHIDPWNALDGAAIGRAVGLGRCHARCRPPTEAHDTCP